MIGQALAPLFCTGLEPVVGQGLVFNWVKLEAPVNGLIGALLGGCGSAPLLEFVPFDPLLPPGPPQLGTQFGEEYPRLSSGFLTSGGTGGPHWDPPVGSPQAVGNAEFSNPFCDVECVGDGPNADCEVV